MEILKTILYMLFALNAIFLVGIVLMQEGKGGGLGNAFGGAGGEASLPACGAPVRAAGSHLWRAGNSCVRGA